jgi:tetratricopeptide (TPR) repeat protein
LGALAVLFQYDIQASKTYVPSYEAYKEFLIGIELFGTDNEKSIKHFLKSVELDSSYILPHLYISMAYHNQGQYAISDSILGFINKNREKLSQFDRIMLDWCIAVNSGDKSKSLRLIRKAEELSPRSYLIKYIIGFTTKDLNLPQLTVETFTEFGLERIGEENRGFWGYIVLVSALYMIEEYNEALNVIQLSSQHFPDQVENLEYEAILQAALGNIQEVNRIINDSFQLSSSAPGSVMMNAVIGLRAHEYRETAHEVLKRALDWFNSRISGDHRYSIAQLLYLDEQWEKAQPIFKQLYQDNPDNLDFLGYLGVVTARLGNREKADKILVELYVKDEPYMFGSNLHWCARIVSILGEYQRAVDFLRESYGKGRSYDMLDLLQMDFEPLRTYKPYIELMRPKD